MLDHFLNDTDYNDFINYFSNLRKLKADIVKFANTYLNNATIVYKKREKDDNIINVEKPQITPLVLNKDTASVYRKEEQNKYARY